MTDNQTKTWITKAGLKATVLKPFGTFYCGYVEIPKTHPLYIKKPQNYKLDTFAPDSIWLKYEKLADEKLEKLVNSDYFSFDVHGGITWRGWRKDNDIYEYGFDCNHWVDESNPKNENFCVNECEKLAEQLVALQKRSEIK